MMESGSSTHLVFFRKVEPNHLAPTVGTVTLARYQRQHVHAQAVEVIVHGVAVERRCQVITTPGDVARLCQVRQVR
jgi:hypothetical protein